MWRKLIFFLIYTSVIPVVYTQTVDDIQEYRNDQLGNISERREGVLDGNNTRTIFKNNSEIGQWPFSPSGEWPKGSGNGYLDGSCLLISAQVLAPGTGHVITPLITNYREWIDYDKVTGQQWVLEPVPGYYNISSQTPAQSNLKGSWPEKWPVALGLKEEDRTAWHSIHKYMKSQPAMESFYVMDDSKDQEFTRDPYQFFPVQSNHDRGGLGLRVEAGMVQFDNGALRDVLFATYDVINISDYDYNQTVFGFYIDCGVGGLNDSGDDNANYIKDHEMVYFFDTDNVNPQGNFPVGFMGCALLKTPDNRSNSLDDDGDRIIDESQYDGIDNDGDWKRFEDVNNNGYFDEGDNLNDDLGADGIGPEDENYIGPDFGEGDGMPTIGEPNFELRDEDEADQMGLTGMSIYRLGDGGTSGGWPKDDDAMWLKLTSNQFDVALQNANISVVFASGLFPFKSAETKRITNAMVFGNSIEELTYNKIVSQTFYNSEFGLNFKTIPVLMKVGEGGNTLSGIVNLDWAIWDFPPNNLIAEIFISDNGDTFDRLTTDYSNTGSFSFNTADFRDGIFYKFKVRVTNGLMFGEVVSEDYFTINNESNALPEIKITSPIQKSISDQAEISWIAGDADGEQVSVKIFYKSGYDTEKILLFESPDNSVSSFMWNTIDFRNSQQNYLIAEVKSGSDENSISWGPFTINNFRKIIAGKNIITNWNSVGTGSFAVSIVKSSLLVPDEYSVVFKEGASPDQLLYNIFNVSKNIAMVSDAVLKDVSEESPSFDGLSVLLSNDTKQQVIDSLTGWVAGNCNYSVYVKPDDTSPAKDIYSPNDYELIWFDEPQGYTPFFKLPVNFIAVNITEGDTVEVEIFDNDQTGMLSVGDELVIIERTPTNDYRLTWNLQFSNPPNGQNLIGPKAGDIFRITPHKPFRAGDSFAFSGAKIISGVEDERQGNIDGFSLSQNYPNPFNPTTRIEFFIPGDIRAVPAKTTLEVFDLLGRKVKTLVDEFVPAGKFSVDFDASYLSSGVYFYRLKFGNYMVAKKMILIR